MESLYLFPPDDNPQKTCTGPCGRTLDATNEYFHFKKDGKYGLAPVCKQCRIKPSTKSDIPEGHKRCKGPCNQILPATAEYFQRNGSNGFHTTCKRCKNKRPVINVTEGHKWCSGCEQEYPATEEYFTVNGTDKDGKERLYSKCKACRKKYVGVHRGKREIKEHEKKRRKEYNSRPEVKEHVRIQRKEYNRRPEVRERDRPRQAAYNKEYYNRPENKENYRKWAEKYNRRPEVQERSRVHCHNRYARKKAISGTHTPAQIQDQLKRQKHKCYYCHARFKKVKGRHIYHVDHTFPISRVAGTDIPANSIDYLVLACPHCNVSKNDKFPWEWPEGGRLL